MPSALVWDMGGLVPPETKAELAWEELARYWAELRGDDAETAYRAVRLLGRAPEQAVTLPGGHLHTVQAVPEERIRALVGQLGSERFLERERATQELLRLPAPCRP